MSVTVLSSATREVAIGAGRPFVMIGDRLSPTGRVRLVDELVRGDFEAVRFDALAQVAAGAQMLDVNACTPDGDEASLLAEMVSVVQSVTDVPLSLDSAHPHVLGAALAAYEGRALVNSVTGEERSLELVLPLVAEHGAAVVAICFDDDGISHHIDTRLAVARKIVRRASAYGIPECDVVIDPIVMPVGAVGTVGRQTMELVRRASEELGANTICGASNVSFGLPNRPALSAAFLSMTIAAGLTSALMNPLHRETVDSVRAAEALLGNDQDCSAWISAHRDPAGATHAAVPR